MAEESMRARAEGLLRGEFRERIWEPFRSAVEDYGLIAPGDRIAVCISGGKDSMLLACLMRMLREEPGGIPFSLRYLVMDPGYNPANRRQVEENARLLELPCDVVEEEIFRVANAQEKNPCFLCARMRRGYLYSHARALGCGTIALGHHFDDVIETTLMAALWGAQLQAMPPRLTAAHFEGMGLIRPLYRVRERDILAWRDACGLTFIRCACRFTEQQEAAGEEGHAGSSKRQEVKELLRRLDEEVPGTSDRVFESIHRLAPETFAGWKSGGVARSFQDGCPLPPGRET